MSHKWETKFKPGDKVVLIKGQPPCEVEEVGIVLPGEADKNNYPVQPDGKQYRIGYRLKTEHLDGFGAYYHEDEQIILNALR